MTSKFIYLFACFLALLSFTTPIAIDSNDSIHRLLTKTDTFEAGDTIILKFSTTNSVSPQLYISHSYGSTLITPYTEDGNLNYQIPESISTKTGFVLWKLLNEKNPLSGQFTVTPKQHVSKLETYLGPPSIQAGERDFTMLVVIPTDVYDNPLADSTTVHVKHQFLNQITHDRIYVKNRISHKNIYAPTQSGRMLISSEALGFNSKEYTANILPAIPTNFNISYTRHHDYADGNQITTFSTSIIKDPYDNIVSDGTYVDFFITSSNTTILKTSGTTIHGVAYAKMIHPDHEDQWTVKAYIEGMAESNTIELNFKPVISDFKTTFSKNNRILTMGPLKSFMEQMIPDGLEVSVSIYKANKKIKTLTKSTFEGYTTFKLDTNNFPNDTYSLNIKVAGIEKHYTNKKLW